MTNKNIYSADGWVIKLKHPGEEECFLKAPELPNAPWLYETRKEAREKAKQLRIHSPQVKVFVVKVKINIDPYSEEAEIPDPKILKYEAVLRDIAWGAGGVGCGLVQRMSRHALDPDDPDYQ